MPCVRASFSKPYSAGRMTGGQCDTSRSVIQGQVNARRRGYYQRVTLMSTPAGCSGGVPGGGEKAMSEKTYDVLTSKTGVPVKAWIRGVSVEEQAKEQL